MELSQALQEAMANLDAQERLVQLANTPIPKWLYKPKPEEAGTNRHLKRQQAKRARDAATKKRLEARS